MSSEDPPSFLLLNPPRLIPLSSNHGKHLLGRLCESMPRPLQKFVPDEPVVPLDPNDQVVETILKNAKITVDSLKRSAVEGKLKHILEVAYQSTSHSAYSLESQWIRTVTLPQQDLALKKICTKILAQEDDKKRLNERDRWYMVVSLMTCGSGNISKRLFTSKNFVARLEMPLSQALSPQTAILGSLLPNPEIGGETTREKIVAMEGDISEETVIAVEYREVHGPAGLWGIIRDIKSAEDAQFGSNSPIPHKPGLAMSGPSGGYGEIPGPQNENEKTPATRPVDLVKEMLFLKDHGIPCVEVRGEVFGLTRPDVTELEGEIL